MVHRAVLAALLAATCLAITPSPTAGQTPLGAAFTYQGDLRQGGEPFDGAVPLRFRLFDAPTGGVQIGPTLDLPTVQVADGRFTVELDFGASPFTGEERWLEIDVDGTVLAPRQRLAAAPYALHALEAGAATPMAVELRSFDLAGAGLFEFAEVVMDTSDGLMFDPSEPGVIMVPKSGFYLISAMARVGSTGSAANVGGRLVLHRNGVAFAHSPSFDHPADLTGTTHSTLTGAWLVELEEADQLTLHLRGPEDDGAGCDGCLGSATIHIAEYAVGARGPAGPAGPPGTIGSLPMAWQGDWSPSATYRVNDGVADDGASYLSLVDGNTGLAPPSAPAAWAMLAARSAPGAQGPQGPAGPQGEQGPPGLRVHRASRGRSGLRVHRASRGRSGLRVHRASRGRPGHKGRRESRVLRAPKDLRARPVTRIGRSTAPTRITTTATSGLARRPRARNSTRLQTHPVEQASWGRPANRVGPAWLARIPRPYILQPAWQAP